jgi:hypothetical protein
MKDRAELNRYLAVFALTAPGAVVMWLVFRGVYFNLSESEKAVGYVDPTTQSGIYLGYLVMIGGALILAALAAWSGFHILRMLLRNRSH